MDLGLDGRVVLVTGGSGGLGLATARALVADGARVVLSGRTADRLASAAGELRAIAPGTGEDPVLTVVADNADPVSADALVAAARERWGRLDAALVSVGGPPPGSVTGTTDEQWRDAFESVFLGTVRLARTVAAALDDGGSIALVLSTSVKAPIAHLAASNGLRPGLGMVAKQLADELGPRGIRVNALLPGRIGTERVQWLDDRTDDPAAARARAESAIPLGRYGEPDEFGRVAAFVLSPAASFLTGVMLPVDGGLTRAL
ncbi:MAG: oxidoreductase [Nocardioides sp.]|nr:oxidoreductase [Nocardioides sp.]